MHNCGAGGLFHAAVSLSASPNVSVSLREAQRVFGLAVASRTNCSAGVSSSVSVQRWAAQPSPSPPLPSQEGTYIINSSDRACCSRTGVRVRVRVRVRGSSDLADACSALRGNSSPLNPSQACLRGLPSAAVASLLPAAFDVSPKLPPSPSGNHYPGACSPRPLPTPSDPPHVGNGVPTLGQRALPGHQCATFENARNRYWAMRNSGGGNDPGLSGAPWRQHGLQLCIRVLGLSQLQTTCKGHALSTSNVRWAHVNPCGLRERRKSVQFVLSMHDAPPPCRLGGGGRGDGGARRGLGAGGGLGPVMQG